MSMDRPQSSKIEVRDRGRLPHWEIENGIYFVTFRLADAIPANILKNEHKQSRLAAKLWGRHVEKYLDEGHGACFLKNEKVAELVASALEHFDGKRYLLFTWCIMPNHVHVVFKVLPVAKLQDVMHSWKSYTAKKANRILGRTGPFWQREYYDRLVRNEKELDRVIDYVINNPFKARLTNWKWVKVDRERLDPYKPWDPASLP